MGSWTACTRYSTPKHPHTPNPTHHRSRDSHRSSDSSSNHGRGQHGRDAAPADWRRHSGAFLLLLARLSC